jgi:hypothetical protein
LKERITLSRSPPQAKTTEELKSFMLFFPELERQETPGSFDPKDVLILLGRPRYRWRKSFSFEAPL